MAKGSRETSALRTFRNRVRQGLHHMELVDAALILTTQTASKVQNKKQSLIKGLPISGKYETLHLPAKQHQQATNQARNRNVEMVLVEIYTAFTEYLREVLLAIHRREPLELVRDAAVDLTPAEAAAAGDEEALRELHFERAFRNLEVRGNAEVLVHGVLEATGVSLNDEVIREALMFLEMRNLYLYNDGVVDERYARSYGKDLRVKAGDRLPRNAKLGRRGLRGVEKLCLDLDSALLRNRLLKAS